MGEIESEKVFVRLEPAESIACKRDILESIINLIQSQIVSKRFEELRKAEMKIMGQLRIALRGINTDVDQVMDALPRKATTKKEKWEKGLKKEGRIAIGEMGIKEKYAIPKGISKTKKYQLELKNIKAKLERLG